MIWWTEQIDWMIFVYWEWWSGFWFDLQSSLYLWHLNVGGPLQLFEARFFRKNSTWEEATKNDQKWPKKKLSFFHILKKWFYWFLLEMTLKKDTVFYLTVLIPYLGKLFLLSCSWKGFQPIRLQDSLIHIDKQPEKWKKIQLNFSWMWSGMPKAAHNRGRCS